MIAKIFSGTSFQRGRRPRTDEDATYGSSGDSGDRPLPEPSLNLLLPSNARVIILAICLAFGNLVSSLLSNSLFVMIDVLADDLKIEETNLQWVFNSFQLPFGCFILISGKAADTIGKKQVFLIGASAIIIATLVTGFMKNSTGFFVCRAFAGVGTALLMACNFGILAEYTAPNGRVRSIALAIMLAGQTSGGALAYLVSGPLVEAIGWRPMFYLVAGLYVLSLIAVIFVARHRVVMDDRKVVDKRIDWVGGLSFTLGAVFLFTSLSQALRESQGWKTPYIIGLLASSVILMSAAVGWARYLEKNTTYPPIMRISVLTRNKGKVAAMLFIVCFCVGGYAGLIYTSNLFYQRFEDMKPSKLMLRFLPARIVGAICNIGVGFLASKIAGRWLFLVSCCGTATANVLFAAMNQNAIYWTYQFFGMSLCSLGSEIGATTASIYIANNVDPSEVAVVGSSLSFMVMLGNIIAPAFSTLIYTRLVIVKHGSPLSEAESKKSVDLLASLRASFWFWSALCFLATLLTAIFLYDLGIVERKESQPRSQSEESKKAISEGEAPEVTSKTNDGFEQLSERGSIHKPEEKH